MWTWVVLGLVFLDEVLALVALGIWGTATSGLAVGIAAGIAGVLAWALFASPKAPFGHRIGRPVVKALVFTLASAGLWAAGYSVLGVVLFVFSAVVNGLAELPAVRATAAGSPAGH